MVSYDLTDHQMAMEAMRAKNTHMEDHDLDLRCVANALAKDSRDGSMHCKVCDRPFKTSGGLISHFALKHEKD